MSDKNNSNSQDTDLLPILAAIAEAKSGTPLTLTETNDKAAYSVSFVL